MKTDPRPPPPSAQESLRIRAVKAVLAGHTQVEVAGIFEVPRQTVGLWVKAHRRGGLRALKAKKRARRAFERDPERVRRWLDEEYPAIRSRAKREGAEIYWGDEMGVRSDHVAGRSYGRRGGAPATPGTGARVCW